MNRKKIGLIVPHIVSNVDRELLSGIFNTLKRLNCDLFIITGISNFSPDNKSTPFVMGIQNIYTIIKKGGFDGFLYAADWFTDKELKNNIYEMLKNSGVPCLVIEEKNDFFPHIFPDERSMTQKITKHLIKEHNCRKIYFLAGFKSHHASEERLEGFKNGLSECGTDFSDDMVFYGDFWTFKPAQLGRDLAEGKIPMPDAVVCASDIMAISLIDSLTETGINVPEDIKITGNDGEIDGLLHLPSLTTICGRNYQLGTDTALKIAEIIGIDTNDFSCSEPVQRIEYRASCGCSKELIPLHQNMLSEVLRPYYFRRERYTAMTTDFIDKLIDNDNLNDTMYFSASFSYRLPNLKNLTICLCKDWTFDFSDINNYRKTDFSDKLIAALEMNKASSTCLICENEIEISEIIPKSVQDDVPTVYLLTSLHTNDQIFGFICTGYNDTNDIFLDDNYCVWCETLGRGLYETERRMYQKYTRQQLSMNFNTDPETGFLTMHSFKTNASDFIKQNGECILQVITWTDKKPEEDFHFASMLSVAIKNTSENKSELAARISDDAFVLLYPKNSESSDRRQLFKRLDGIEDSFSAYSSHELYISFPQIYSEISTLNECPEDEIEKSVSVTMQKSRLLADSCENDKDYKSQLIKIRRNIRKNPENNWSVSEIATTVHVSRGHFQRLYNDIFGTSCMDDIISIRLGKAKKLLLDSNMKISEISDACGYENTNHFMRQFKMNFDETALQFRKKSRRTE